MKKRTVSRRKFLTTVGIATAGTAALSPVMKRSLVKAWSNPQLSAPQKKDLFFTNMKVRTRAAGSHLLPLAKRPV